MAKDSCSNVKFKKKNEFNLASPQNCVHLSLDSFLYKYVFKNKIMQKLISAT